MCYIRSSRRERPAGWDSNRPGRRKGEEGSDIRSGRRERPAGWNTNRPGRRKGEEGSDIRSGRRERPAGRDPNRPGRRKAKRDRILDQVEERGRQDGIRIGREEERAKRDRILDQVEEKGRQDGIDCMNRLIGILIHQGNMDDVERVCEDEHLREEFLVRYHIK